MKCVTLMMDSLVMEQRDQYNRQKNYKYKPQHRNSYNRKQTSDRKMTQDKEKNGRTVPFKNPVKSASRKPQEPASKLKIIPLGGLEQIGMNITAFEYEDSIVVVDCGLAFPEDEYAGNRSGHSGCYLFKRKYFQGKRFCDHSRT